MAELIPVISQESHGALPEALREFYTQNDSGAFVLQVKPTDGWALEDVGGLKNTLGQVATKRDELKRQLEAYGDLTPDAIAELQRNLESLKGATPADQVEALVKERLGTSLQERDAAHEKAMGELQEELQSREGQLSGLIVDAEIDRALSGLEDLIDGGAAILRPHVREAVRMAKRDDGQFIAQVVDREGQTRYSMKTGSTDPMGVSEFVGTLAEDAKFKALFRATATGSGGNDSNKRTGANVGDGAKSGQDEAAVDPVERLARARSGG
ncbi:MAG: hypothetical protein CMJ75_18610 [Planctomycetaceae bacterium]|nr:hypothetical protein [Planctomycetaceae bacterium]